VPPTHRATAAAVGGAAPLHALPPRARAPVVRRGPATGGGDPPCRGERERERLRRRRARARPGAGGRMYGVTCLACGRGRRLLGGDGGSGGGDPPCRGERERRRRRRARGGVWGREGRALPAVVVVALSVALAEAAEATLPAEASVSDGGGGEHADRQTYIWGKRGLKAAA
jgi:hypothetical protein